MIHEIDRILCSTINKGNKRKMFSQLMKLNNNNAEDSNEYKILVLKLEQKTDQ